MEAGGRRTEGGGQWEENGDGGRWKKRQTRVGGDGQGVGKMIRVSEIKCCLHLFIEASKCIFR